jgi:hypothetical protein
MFGQRPGNQQPLVKPSITPEHLLIIFGVLVNNQNLFVKVKPTFTPELLNGPGEEFHAAFLRTLISHYDRYNILPSRQAALADLMAISRDPYSGIPEGIVRNEVDTIYNLTENVSRERLTPTENLATDILEELLIERRVISQARSVLMNASGTSLVNASQIFDQASRGLQDVRRLMTRNLISSVPQVRQRSNNYISFDHDMGFLNALTHGGLHRKTVSGLFGVFGGCKTTLATQSAASRINLEWNKYLRGETPEIVIFGNCEGGPEEISYRVLSFLAKIPARKIRDHFNSIAPLRDFVPSESDDYQNKFGIPLSETERLAEAIEKIDKIFKIIDLSGSTEGSDSLGKDYVNDLEMMVDSYCQDSGMGVSYFLLDYAKAFTRRYMDLTGQNVEAIRHYLGRLPDYIRRQISDKFDCASLILQQMNKAALSKKPGSLLSHVDASEASDFGENCWFCFTLSQPVKNDDDKLVTNLNMSKCRDVEPPKKMPSLEFMPYCQGLRLTDDFRVVNNSIQHVESRDVVAATEGPQRRVRQARPTSPTSVADMNPLEGF